MSWDLLNSDKLDPHSVHFVTSVQRSMLNLYPLKGEWQYQGISWLSITFLFPVLFWDFLKKCFWGAFDVPDSRMSPCKELKKAAPLMLQKMFFFSSLSELYFEQKMKANQSMLKWDNIWDTHLSTNQHTLLSFLNPSLISGILDVIIAHYRQAFYAIAFFCY